MTRTQPLPAVDAVRRCLEIDDLGDHVRTTIILSTILDTAPAQLWPLLTAPDRLRTWYGPVAGDFSEHGTLRTATGADVQVLEVEAPHKLSLAWRSGGSDDPVLIRLDPEDDGSCELRLRHATLMPRSDFDRCGPGIVAIGWEVALLALAAATDAWRAGCLIAAPAPTAHWLAGPEGRAHVRAWAVRWAAEAVAAGVDERVARAGEAETIRLVSAGLVSART